MAFNIISGGFISLSVFLSRFRTVINKSYIISKRHDCCPVMLNKRHFLEEKIDAYAHKETCMGCAECTYMAFLYIRIRVFHLFVTTSTDSFRTIYPTWPFFNKRQYIHKFCYSNN